MPSADEVQGVASRLALVPPHIHCPWSREEREGKGERRERQESTGGCMRGAYRTFCALGGDGFKRSQSGRFKRFVLEASTLENSALGARPGLLAEVSTSLFFEEGLATQR